MCKTCESSACSAVPVVPVALPIPDMNVLPLRVGDHEPPRWRTGRGRLRLAALGSIHVPEGFVLGLFAYGVWDGDQALAFHVVVVIARTAGLLLLGLGVLGLDIYGDDIDRLRFRLWLAGRLRYWLGLTGWFGLRRGQSWERAWLWWWWWRRGRVDACNASANGGDVGMRLGEVEALLLA